MTEQYYLYENENKGIVPISALDNILKLKTYTNDLNVKFYDILTGSTIDSDENMNYMISNLMANCEKHQYLTTDHLIYSITVSGVNFLYVSLDNSVRSNQNNFPLAHTRLYALLDVVKNIINNDETWIVFFSESCGMSFYGNVGDKQDEVSWITMRNTIETQTKLKFLTEKRNNDDPNGLSFGLSVWHTNCGHNCINMYYTRNVLLEGTGSVIVGIKLLNGEIVWGCHFPIDFKNDGELNLGYKTMKNIQSVISEYDGSICVIGDMNMIRGKINDAILSAIDNDKFELVLPPNVYTFFGAFYDTIPNSAEWKKLIY